MWKRITLSGLLALLLSIPALAQLIPSGGAATNLTQIGGTNVVTGGVNGSLGVGGLAAVGATAAGNPVQIGGIFNTSPATITNGQAGALQLDNVQNLLVKVNTALPAGTNVIGHVITDSASTTVVTGTVAVTESGTWTVQPGNTANTTAWLVKTYPVTACGGTNYSQAWIAVPTSNTAATSTTTCVTALEFTNTNATAQTVTVTDNQGTPVTMVATYSIPGNSSVVFPFYGAQATSGIKWQAGGTGVTGAIFGYQ